MDDDDEIPEVNESLEGAKYYVNCDETSPKIIRGRSSITNPNFDFDSFKQTTSSLTLSDRPSHLQLRDKERSSFFHETDCPLNESNSNTRKLSSGSPKCKLYMKSRLKDGKHKQYDYEEKLVFVVDTEYIKKCDGIFKIIQIVLSSVMLIMLVTTGRQDGGLLLLPLSWHFRVMLFVLILTILSSIFLLFAHMTNIVSLLPFDWIICDLVLHSAFSFLYLVGTSLVASAFDFYDKMNSNVSRTTINQLVICVVLGYVCMLCYGLTALSSYRRWRIQYNLYQRKHLIEEEELDI